MKSWPVLVPISLLLFLLPSLPSCGGEPDYSISEDEERRERREQRRRRMNVLASQGGQQYEFDPSNAFGGGNGLPPGWTAAVADRCAADISERYGFATPSGACESFLYSMLEGQCHLEILQDLAETELPFSMQDPVSMSDVILPPQLPEARGALWRASVAESARLVATVGDTLRRTYGVHADFTPEASTDCSVADLEGTVQIGPLKPGRVLANVFTEAAAAAAEAGTRFASIQHDLAEAELSRSTSRRVATELAWMDEDMSRTEAVRLLLGDDGSGGSGMFGYSDGAGPCPMDQPSEDDRGIIRIIESTGDTSVFDLGISTDNLFMNPGGLRDRMAEITGDTTLLALPDAPAVADYLGFHLADVDGVREYLAEEQRAFARDPRIMIEGGIPLSPDTPLGPATQLDNVSAAVLEGSRSVPRPFLVARARHVSEAPTPATLDERPLVAGNRYPAGPTTTPPIWPVTPEFVVDIPPAGTHQPAVADILDYALDVASDLGPGNTSPIGTGSPVDDQVADELRRFGQGMAELRPHTSQLCLAAATFGDSPVTVRAAVSGVDAADIRLVRGVTGLRCATEGRVEEQPCDLDDYDVTDVSTQESWTLSSSDRHYGRVAVDSVTSDAMDLFGGALEIDQWVFALVPREGAVAPAEGDYTSVGSIRLVPAVVNKDPSLFEFCTEEPYFPLFEKESEDLMAPSTQWCATSEVTCAGPGFADTIPLENELTSDGDLVEDSWRYYLDLAQSAAERADRLGEDLIDAGFALDENLEAAEDEVRAICGDDVDLGDAFWDLLNEPPAGACSCTTGESSCGDCPSASYVCENGMCVHDLEAYIEDQVAAGNSDLVGLRDCIGEHTKTPYSTPGSRPLCMWEYNGQLCDVPMGMEDEGWVCPWLVDDGTTCELPPALVGEHGLSLVEQAVPLDVYVSALPADQNPPPREQRFDCDRIRQYRAYEEDERTELGWAAAAILAEDTFQYDRLSELAAQIGWRGEADDFATVTVNGKPWVSTGSAVGGGATDWPCSPWASDFCAAHAGGTAAQQVQSLFCSHAAPACSASTTSNREYRAAMNQRLLRAVITLRLMTANPIGDIRVPFRPNPLHLTVEADRERAGNEFEKVRWYFDDGQAGSLTLADGGVTLGRASLMSLRIFEHDPSEDDHADVEIDDADIYCTQGSVAQELWTHIGADAWSRDGSVVGSLTPFATSVQSFCNTEGTTIRDAQLVAHMAEVPLVFRAVQEASTGQAPSMTRDMWSFEDGFVATDVDWSTGEHRGIIPALLRSRTLDFVQPGVPLGGGTEAQRGQVGCRINQPGSARDRWECDPTTFHRFHEADMYNQIGPFTRGAWTLSNTFHQSIPMYSVLDALELACEVNNDALASDDPLAPSHCPEWGDVSGTNYANLREGQRLMTCLADEVQERGERVVFVDMPGDVIEALRGTIPFEGDRGVRLSELSADMVTLARFPEKMAGLLRDTALLLKDARLLLARNEVQQELINVELMSTQLRELTTCISAGFQAAGQAIGTVAGSGIEGKGTAAGAAAMYAAAAAATCANSIGQVVLANQRAGLEGEIVEIDTDSGMVRITRDLGRNIELMGELTDEAKRTELRIRGALGAVETQRLSLLDTVEDVMTINGNDSATDTVRRRRFNTLYARYQEAHRYAIRTSWLARRALEQRLGMNLLDMHDDMHLVDAPSDWANEVCAMSGFDYREIRDGDLLIPGDSFHTDYVSDYVQRLRAVFESYSIDHPFTDGEDVAVVSLRDQLVGSDGQPCDVPSRNLLAWSDHLAAERDPFHVRPEIEFDSLDEPIPQTDEEVNGAPAWQKRGCATTSVTYTTGDTENPDTTFDSNAACVTVVAHVEGGPAAATGPLDGEFGGGQNYVFVFGGDGIPDPSGPGYIRTWTEDARIAQEHFLEPGVYRVSWYGSFMPGWVGVDAADPADAGLIDQAPAVNHADIQPIVPEPGASAFTRYFYFFEVEEATTVEVWIGAAPDFSPTLDGDGQPATLHFVDVAAPMLENVSAQFLTRPTANLNAYPPFTYVPTRASGTSRLPVCQDSTGATFRSRWRKSCTRLCDTGLQSCGDAGQLACFWEAPFDISLGDLESGGPLARSNFAFGNFNYRWSNASLNVVGVGVRDCESSPFPDTCYAAGNVSYSLYHDPSSPYLVRNHTGGEYRAPLFPARVEHARALTAERYISNPMSSADRALVEPYTRTEFRGRPLAGHYRIRIWDDGALDWSRVEDIQLVLGYRYWSRAH